MLRGVGQHRFSGSRVEPQEKADLLGRSSDFVPGDPEIVRVAQLGLAVMQRQLIRSENILANRHGWIGVWIRIVEGVDRHSSVDHDRLVGAIVKEHDAPTETSNRLLARLVQNRIAPNGGRFRRDTWLRFGLHDRLF